MTLREKIKTIIFNRGGLPGLNQIEFMDEIRSILYKELTRDEKSYFNRNNIRLDSLIVELSQEIADEYL